MPNSTNSTTDRPEATDGMWDTSDRAMAARFGRRALELARTGRDPKDMARLAASLAFKVEPSLREDIQ